MLPLCYDSYMPETPEYNVYIDESGDEGIGRGSKYFILTAIVVKKSADLRTAAAVDQIKRNLELPITAQLHWNTLHGYPNKMMIMQTIGRLNATIINVVVNTTCIHLIPSNSIYNYFSGYLFERISWLMRARGGVANIHISSRGNLSKMRLTSYLTSHNDEKFKIDMSRIKTLKIIPNGRKKLLQLADCCCSALYQALRYNDSRHYQYIKEISGKFYTYQGRVKSYGLKLVSGGCEAKEVDGLMRYLKSGRIPKK